MISRLLRKNTSPARIAGFMVSNLIGLTIMAVGLQFYLDAYPIWDEEDSFLKSEYIAINKVIDASSTLGDKSPDFTPEEIADLQAQPWAERVGAFTRADFKVYGSLALTSPSDSNTGDTVNHSENRRLSTAMFFEAVPDEFIDVKDNGFRWTPDSEEIPIIISKDYLALYNFGFAGAAGLPRMSESLVSGIPLQLTTVSADGKERRQFYGRVVGYSNRFNTILVPESFIRSMNQRDSDPSRLIIDVNSPGDTAIRDYLDAKGWEQAGDNTSSSATFMLRIISGIIIAIGSIITILSLFILILSISLLMEKNRRKLHSLLMLGYRLEDVARPYLRLTLGASTAAGCLAVVAVILLRNYWLAPLRSLGGGEVSIIWSIILIVSLTIAIIAVNTATIRHRVKEAWR
ncbi:MAG: ABC transporter permease [Muribaculaceae bacterium]|nr:ABC transporter permease [Muribaculaceae bacterium]